MHTLEINIDIKTFYVSSWTLPISITISSFSSATLIIVEREVEFIFNGANGPQQQGNLPT